MDELFALFVAFIWVVHLVAIIVCAEKLCDLARLARKMDTHATTARGQLESIDFRLASLEQALKPPAQTPDVYYVPPEELPGEPPIL